VIEKTAIVDSKAKIAKNVKIGHYSIVGPDVEIGAGCEIGNHVTLEGPMKIGKDNRIFHYAYIGGTPQDLAYKNEKSFVEIGDNNIIREYVTIHRATAKQNRVTFVGNSNFIMAYVHIAHDCSIGSNCILANAINMAGHVTIEDYASIGGMVAIHQFVRIGRYSFVGGFTAVTQDVLPYSMIAGERGALKGINKIGLQRWGFDSNSRNKLQKVMRYLMNGEVGTSTAVDKLVNDYPEDQDVDAIIEFINKSKRGITL
jgi:UDP-N-acetylglucosamine acyltransferase